MRNILAVLAIIAVCGASSSTANGSILFSNLDSGTNHSTAGGASISGSSNFDFGRAMPFSLSSSATLISLDMGLKFGSGPNQITIELEGDNGAGRPNGTILASGSISAYTTNLATNLVSFAPSGDPVTLTANTTYWILVLPGASTTSASWMAVTATGTTLLTNAAGTTFSPQSTPMLSLQVTGTPVPEPASTAFLAVGGLALFAGRRRVGI